jgi:hypothetical protein
MIETADIRLHAGETWKIPFTVHDADGVAIDLTDGRVDFRLSGADGPLLTLSTDDSIAITDAAAGSGEILITPAAQETGTLEDDVAYRYELKIETPTFGVSVQKIGRLKVLPSLFHLDVDD